MLRRDGTLWLNMGGGFLPNKQMDGLPWRLALALQADGWWLRSEIIWAKPNPMPESIRDRPTKAHEQVFLLTKRGSYYYDADAIREAHQDVNHPVINGQFVNPASAGGINSADYEPHTQGWNGTGTKLIHRDYNPAGRNARSVWTIPTESFAGAHFATYPTELVRRCIAAGTSEHGVCGACGAPWARVVERTPMEIERSGRTHDLGRTRTSGTMTAAPSSRTLGWRPTCAHPETPVVPATVLDPFAGAGTTVMVALRMGRRGLGIELNPEYVAMAERRILADHGAESFDGLRTNGHTPSAGVQGRMTGV